MRIAHGDTLGRWNQLVIDVRGPSIAVTVNGTSTAVMTQATRRTGVLALQYTGDNALRFRDLAVTPL